MCLNKVNPIFIQRQAFVASILKPLCQVYGKMFNKNKMDTYQGGAIRGVVLQSYKGVFDFGGVMG